MNHEYQKTALIYCPNTGGHRHMYAKLFAGFFLKKQYRVVFAHCGFLERTKPKCVFSNHDSSFLKSFTTQPDVTVINLVDSFRPRKQIARVRELQEIHQPNQTLIIDGDAIQWQLAAQLLPWHSKLKDPTSAIFIMSEFMYPGATRMTTLLAQWWLHGRLFRRHPLLKKNIWLDENLTHVFKSPRYAFLPDLVCDPDDSQQPAADQAFYRRIATDYEAFLNAHPGQTPVLSFGDWETRKGQEFLSRLVVENPNLLLVRIGRMKPSLKLSWPLIQHRERLLKENRIFEVTCYIESAAVTRRLFESVAIIALPYQDFYRTSANMLTALRHGKPLLVPDQGLMRFRVENHHVGLTYRHGSYESFRDQFYKLLASAEQYEQPVKDYAEQLSEQSLDQRFEVLFSDRPGPLPEQSTYPKRTLPDLLYWRLHRTAPAWSRPLLLSIRKAVRVLSERLAVLRYERYAKRQWRKLAGRTIAVYGTGKHTEWLHHLVQDVTPAPTITAVLDDNPQPGTTFWNCPTTATNQWKADCPVILSSDTMQQRMKSNLEEQFGPAITIIDLYADLPAGPYPKRKFPKTTKAHS